MRRFLILISLLVLSNLSLPAQPDSLRLGYLVKGTVVDAATGKPLESVHISIPERHQATVSNADGSFVLKSDRPITEISCSFLGYRTAQVKAAETVHVGLYRENLQLSEATIVTGDPRSIVEATVARIRDNYCPQAELLECFYRETVRKRNRYTYVAEAVARLYKHRYDGNNYRDAAALEKSRVLVSQRKSDTLSVKTQGGPNQAITLDFLKNTDLLFYPEDMDLYRFRMEMPTYIGDRLQFVISMEAAGEADYALYNARLYIDRELLSFTRIEASLDMKDRAKATRMLLVSKPIGLRFFPEEASVVVNYRLSGTQPRLEYIRSTIRFSCDWRKRLFKTHYTTVNELVVTDLRPQAQPIQRKERFQLNDYLNDKAPEFQDPDFWKDYNIIEPSESLEHALSRLRKTR